VDAGTGAASFGASATAHTTTLGSVTGAASTVLQSGSGHTLITSTGDVQIDATAAVDLNSTGAAIRIGNDADNNAISIGEGGTRTVTIGGTTGASAVVLACGTGGVSVGTSANAHTTTVGSTNTTSDTVIQAGTGGLSLEPISGDISMVPATNSVAATSITLNAKLGSAKFTGVTTASSAQETFTITNSEVSATSVIFVTVTNLGSNDCRLTLERVKPAAGSFTVDTQNNGSAACNGDILINFWVFA
jgi:hypothetical protein